jgi:hypothetical protein
MAGKPVRMTMTDQWVVFIRGAAMPEKTPEVESE